MSAITLYGPAYSAYTRIVRVVLEEKGAAYKLEEVDFISSGMPAEQKVRHPFGVVPAITHDGEILFETRPICTYLDEVLPDPPLQPEDTVARARMHAAISSLDNYIWPDIRELTTQSIFTPMVGGWPDETVTARMVKRLEKSLETFEAAFLATGLLGTGFTLADAHAAPMFAYLSECAEGQVLLSKRPPLKSWWEGVKDRPSVAATAWDLEAYPWAQREMPD